MNRPHISLPRRLAPAVLGLCLGLTALTSCEVMIDEPIEAQMMKIDRDNFVLMMGDTCRLNIDFTPHVVTNLTAFWELIDSVGVINVLDNGSVVATQPGEADVRIVTANAVLTDTIHVRVIEDWRELYDTYPYDMFVYADVNFKNYHNDASGLRIGAFIDDELRGFGEVRTDHGVTYTLFRIWHDRPNGAKVTFRYYLPREYSTGDMEFSIDFDEGVHGRLNNLISITR